MLLSQMFPQHEPFLRTFVSRHDINDRISVLGNLEQLGERARNTIVPNLTHVQFTTKRLDHLVRMLLLSFPTDQPRNRYCCIHTLPKYLAVLPLFPRALLVLRHESLSLPCSSKSFSGRFANNISSISRIPELTTEFLISPIFSLEVNVTFSRKSGLYYLKDQHY